jgi:Fe(3+) dicitrate transport protein
MNIIFMKITTFFSHIPFKRTLLSFGLFFFLTISITAQFSFSGTITNADKNNPLNKVEVYLINLQKSAFSDKRGNFIFENLPNGSYDLTTLSVGFTNESRTVEIEDKNVQMDLKLSSLSINLSEVVVKEQAEKNYGLKRLKAVEGTAIYAGKKTEVILLDQLTINAAANNARQIYSQIVGLNIYESNDAGLQLNIGGRGLDPNRSASFNTRQNGYDISADVLGYPESYYSPPAEALQEIQVIRGAASLQYGTQFGGLVNFIFKKPISNKKVRVTSRQTVGSNSLFTSFNSLSGTVGKLSYYTYFNYKRGEGFRPNSGFDSKNFFAHVGYELSPKTTINFEFTSLKYLAQQAGGLTDAQFYENPNFSNRTRNWFEVDWHLFSARLEHEFSENTDLSLQLFGLDASRKAVGFRTNRVSQNDVLIAPRDLIAGTFQNGGAELRVLHRYNLKEKSAILLLGSKFYKSNNTGLQGAGSNGADADFSLQNEKFPNYPNQSDFTFPNLNVAVFGEHILYLTDKFSITPGLRFEYIKTQSEGDFRRIDFDLAGNPIQNEVFEDNRTLSRNLFLAGIGASFKPMDSLETYFNCSQNYRSVTFSDIRIVNPSFQVDPNISDEKGFTTDLGLRGNFKKINYDVNVFGLLYDNRLGEVLKPETRINAEGELVETGRVVRFRGNIGSAFIYGLESFFDWNILRPNLKEKRFTRLNYFVNLSLTDSKYYQSGTPGVEGNKVEFIPLVNLKTGVNFGYKNLMSSLQFTYLSEQFTDASNAPQNPNDNQSGIIGAIPSYQIMDLSLSYKFKFLKLETGVNNLLNQNYFTRRATGYPGPGIIPSAPRTAYLTLQFQL